MGTISQRKSAATAPGVCLPVRQNHFFAVPFAFALVLVLQASAGFAQPGTGITFSGLSGPNLAPFIGDTEGGFVVMPTSGTWLQATIYGNPGPSIVDGPVNAPGIGVIQVTDGAGFFTFQGFDFSSNNGDSAYVVQGFQGATLAYQETGTLAGTFGPFSFSTLHTSDPSVAVNGLLIEVIPGSSATSVNLDNIEVLSVISAPEPGGTLLLGLGLAGIVLLRAKSAN